jgi:hypothetical protein
MNDSRKNAHTSPTAQYTLVSINGKNSIEADDVGLLDTSDSGQGDLSTDAQSCACDSGVV